MLNRAAVQLGSFVWSFGVIALVLGALPQDRELASQPVLDGSQPLALAIAVLRTSDHFTSAGIGYTGITPNEVLAWRVIFNRPDADSIFQDLLNTSTAAGQLYALAGLRFSNSGAFSKAAARLQGKLSLVQTVRGCIVSTQTVAEVVGEIRQGDWVREFIAGRLIPANP
jgi:hypothetical protein